MTRIDLLFLILRVPIDYLALIMAAITAYFLRFRTLIDLRPATETIPFPAYVELALIFGGVWVLIFALVGLYADARRRLLDEIGRVFFGCLVGIMAVVATIFFSRELFASRFVVLVVWFIAFLFVTADRIILRLIHQWILSRGMGQRLVAIVGEGEAAHALALEFVRRKSFGVRVVSQAPRFDEVSHERFAALARTGELDEVILADPRADADEVTRLLQFSDDVHVVVRYSADLIAERRASLDVETVAGIPLIEVKKTLLEGWGMVYKRIADITGSFILLILLSPALLAIALAILMDSGLPILYRPKGARRSGQMRVGARGRQFRLLKFRTMQVGAEDDWGQLRKLSERAGPIPKIKNDPRITRVGHFLRRTSLDELPQLWNALLGHLSLVGPRPHLPEEVADYPPYARRVLTVKPGITGLAQISGRADLAFDEEVRLDTFYIEHWSPRLDLLILLKTPMAVLRRKGAY